ncbi:MAG: hypothetical protein M0R17_01510 [Candidatus Omnitrophica bacterium]|jgi:hypothetical protein|nr:hypothetical protein [Candidatus Omnitrophota bacterium]
MEPIEIKSLCWDIPNMSWVNSLNEFLNSIKDDDVYLYENVVGNLYILGNFKHVDNELLGDYIYCGCEGTWHGFSSFFNNHDVSNQNKTFSRAIYLGNYAGNLMNIPKNLQDIAKEYLQQNNFEKKSWDIEFTKPKYSGTWDVYLNDEEIDTVFYNTDCDEDYIRHSLINHDGYDPSIVVKNRYKRKKKSWDIKQENIFDEFITGDVLEVKEPDEASYYLLFLAQDPRDRGIICISGMSLDEVEGVYTAFTKREIKKMIKDPNGFNQELEVEHARWIPESDLIKEDTVIEMVWHVEHPGIDRITSDIKEKITWDITNSTKFKLGDKVKIISKSMPYYTDQFDKMGVVTNIWVNGKDFFESKGFEDYKKRFPNTILIDIPIYTVDINGAYFFAEEDLEPMDNKVAWDIPINDFEVGDIVKVINWKIFSWYCNNVGNKAYYNDDSKILQVCRVDYSEHPDWTEEWQYGEIVLSFIHKDVDYTDISPKTFSIPPNKAKLAIKKIKT